jgi:hypothetical protein
MGDRTKLCDYTNTPNDQFIAKPITTPEINADSYEVSPSLLNLITREQFGGSTVEDASMHLHDFVEICDMQKFKNVESDILKLKLFPFSLRGKAKEWLHSLPTDSIKTWNDLKEAFIKKYYPPVKILQNRNNILSFRQNENEHVAMAWDRIKLMLRTCPSHGVNEWTILHSFYNGLNYMSRNILDSAAGGAFMGKTIVEAKEILESILQNYSQWHTDRAPSSSKKVNSIEETHDLSSKMDTILALLHKPSVENIPLQELVANNSESVDVNFVRNYGNNGYGNNNYNSYKPPYVPHTRPFVPYPNASDNKWKPLPPSDFDANKLLMEQVASHNTMIQELNKSVASISSDIKGLQLQAAGLDKALSKLADNQATLLSMSAGKPQASPVVGLNAITIAENVPLTFDENLNELLNYPEYLLPLMSHLASLKEEINETESYESPVLIEKVEEVKMLNEVIDPLLDLEKCSLHDLISTLQKFASDSSIDVNQAGFGSYIANHVLKEKIARYNQESMIPPKLGDVWIPKVLVTIGKETHHALLDLGSSVSILSKNLYDVLELRNIEKCSTTLTLADDTITHALGKVSDVMVELHMTFVPVDFLIMDMGNKTSSPIILGRPFLRTTGAVIDSKEGNVKFQFPHKKCMEHFPRMKGTTFKLPHELHLR